MARIRGCIVLLATAVAAMPVLTGCMLMMPIMMAPGALQADHASDSERNRFVNEALLELVANRGDYQIIELGRIETSEHAMPSDRFRKMIVDQMRSSGIRVSEEHPPVPAGGKDLSDGSTEVHAILDAELARAESQDRLDLSLKDARTGQVVWKKHFTSSHGTSSSGHSH